MGKCNFRHEITELERMSPDLQQKMKEKRLRITGKSPVDDATAHTGNTSTDGFPTPLLTEFLSLMQAMRTLVGKPGPCP